MEDNEKNMGSTWRTMREHEINREDMKENGKNMEDI